MSLEHKLGRILISVCFLGLALNQLQYPQETANFTHSRTTQLYKWLNDQTHLGLQNIPKESVPAVILGCAIFKILVSIGILFNYNIAKVMGFIYVAAALFSVYNPFIQPINEGLPMVGLLGGLMLLYK